MMVGMTDPDSRLRERGPVIALYHRMTAADRFEDAAQALLAIVQEAERRWPGRPRHVYLDVDGHRNEVGGFDADAYEWISNFALEFIGPFISELTTPLGRFVPEGEQWDDVPESMEVQG